MFFYTQCITVIKLMVKAGTSHNATISLLHTKKNTITYPGGKGSSSAAGWPDTAADAPATDEKGH